MALETDRGVLAGFPRRPLCLDFRSSKGFIASTVFAATFTDGFAYAILVPVMPFSLVDRSGVAPEQVDFWNSAFLVAFGLAQILASPFIGWWTDRSSSRRAPFLTGLALIFVASILLCFATRPWVMMIARALAGFSAGVVFCTGLTLVVDSVPRKEIVEWMGFALSGMTWGTMTGPLLGGIIYKRAGYYAVFLTLLVVIVFDFILRMTMIETENASKWRDTQAFVARSSQADGSGHIKSNDVHGSRVSCSGETIGAEQARRLKTDGGSSQNKKSTKPRPNAVTPLLGFHGTRDPWYQRRFPALTALLSSKRLVAAVLGTFVYNSLIASFDDILPLFAHRTFGWDSESAGLLYLTIPIPSLSGPFIGMLSDRYGARVVALFGFGLTTPCLALLSLVHKNSVEQIVLLVVLLVLFGVGVNFIIGPLAGDMSFVVEALTKERPELFGKAGAYAQAYSFFAAAMAGGVMFGPAVAGVLYKNVYRFSGGPTQTSLEDAGHTGEA